MTHIDTERKDAARGALDRLLRDNDILLNGAQYRRLSWLVQRFGMPRLNHGADDCQGGVVIVLEPPTGAGAELFARALDGSTIVVIPFGENPAFDFLKSKLTDFGTVGSCGADGPHELWWGGANWTTLKSGGADAAMPRIISCYPRARGERHARALTESAAALQLAADIEPIETIRGDERMTCFEKVEFIYHKWRRASEPLLFIEADGTVMGSPILPSSLCCDIAIHRWNRWEMSARTLYLGFGSATEALLRNWQHLAASFPQVWDGYLLDQAWSLTASQIPLDTVWLPRSYHAPAGDGARHVAVVYDLTTGTDLGPDASFAARMRGARRAARTGAGEALLVMTSQNRSAQSVTVILRDSETTDARAVADSVKAVAGAFAHDCGGFSQFELSLCPWQDDVAAATHAARLANHRIVEIAAGHAAPRDLFRTLSSTEPDRIVGFAG